MAEPVAPAELEDVIRDDVRRALAEDIGAGDITAELVPADSQARASVISREQAVICGRLWFDEVFAQLDDAVRVRWLVEDGDEVQAGDALCQLSGPARALLSGERSALNFLQSLSGTASAARRYADALGDLPVKILDTRKTIPGLRRAQKFAVSRGGCHNHRIGLYDGVLIKENHIAAAGSITHAVRAARALRPDIPVEVETENLEQLREAIESGADIALLDNFDLDGLSRAVALNAGRIKLEASGGVTLDSVRAIAATGVNYVSVGEITKHLRAVDLSMRFHD